MQPRVAFEETLSNRVSDFCNFVCFLFPKAIRYDFYYTLKNHKNQIPIGLVAEVVFSPVLYLEFSS